MNNTGNPVGSKAFLDFEDNVEILDKRLTSDEPVVNDRLGNPHLSWAGIEKAGSGDPGVIVPIVQQAVQDVVAGVDGQVVRAEGYAERAESAAGAAASSGLIFPNSAAGQSSSAVPVGGYFWAETDDSGTVLELWLKGSASPSSTGQSLPSAALVDGLTFSRRFVDLTLSNQFINATGGTAGSGGYRATDFLPVVGGAGYSVGARVDGGAYHAWYDADKSFISSFRGSAGFFSESVFNSPPGARYVRLSTQDTALSRSYIRAASGQYDAEKLNAVLSAHAKGLPASGVCYAETDVATALDKILVRQQEIVYGQGEIYNVLDEQSDLQAPWFVNAWVPTVRYGGGSLTVHTIASRDGARQFTLASTPTDTGNAIVVRDDNTGKHIPMLVTGTSGATLTVNTDLPANISTMMRMHDAIEGQHLSPYGYQALAEFTVDQVQRYAYKKPENLIFYYHPPVCSTTGFNSSDIWDYSLTKIIIPVTRLPGTAVGGVISTGQTRICQTVQNDLNISSGSESQYLSRTYSIRQETSGAGIEIKFSAQGLDGFVELPLAARAGGGLVGSGLLEVLADGVTILSDTISCGSGLQLRYVDFVKASEITIRYSVMESVPTELQLHGIYAYRKSPRTSKAALFAEGDVVALLGDSWTEFHEFSFENRLKSYLSDQGIGVSTANFGRGSQTSAWGLHWVDRVISASPKPTHCIVLFGINDFNSRNFFATNQPSVYDFDPIDPDVNRPFDQGGIKGSTDTGRWWANIQGICRRLLSAGIRPIVMMPAHTSSSSQSQGIRNLQLNKIAAGFSDMNAPRE